jgi:hypothetical protein
MTAWSIIATGIGCISATAVVIPLLMTAHINPFIIGGIGCAVDGIWLVSGFVRSGFENVSFSYHKGDKK